MTKGNFERKGLFGLYLLFMDHSPLLRDFIVGTKGEKLKETTWENT